MLVLQMQFVQELHHHHHVILIIIYQEQYVVNFLVNLVQMVDLFVQMEKYQLVKMDIINYNNSEKMINVYNAHQVLLAQNMVSMIVDQANI